MNCEDLTLHTDKYQVNMMYAHWKMGTHNRKAVFEMYFRKLPFGNGFAVFAGLQRIVDYISKLAFSEEDLDYLRAQEERYEEAFLDELRSFRFTGTLEAVPEGTLVFPGEPLIRVEARIMEAQLVETALLNAANFQTLIATKASRVKQAAGDDTLLEFGTRRAQEMDAAVWGARAAYIAGFHATSNMRAGMMFGMPAKGTHAHAWVQAFDSELEAFMNYAKALPDGVTLLVDTYDTLKSGVPNAIRTGEELRKEGKELQGIRLDSGDLAVLSREARRMLDEAGFPDVKIVASNDLDEHIIMNLKAQGARIDTWGVGTQLITAADQPSLGGVYKLVAREKDGRYEPVIKISGNLDKVSNPGVKDVYRLIDRRSGMAVADFMTLRGDTAPVEGAVLKLVDPAHPYVTAEAEDYAAVPLLKAVFRDGRLTGELPALDEIRAYHAGQLKLFRQPHLRKLHPEPYPVAFSESLWSLKTEMIQRVKPRTGGR
ncbi:MULTISPECIES: nicotinate phosphoribosyltransferase [unclassified Paenibacillus]|uniref:nicotinate phosphoribosyltransferase n=1 Tax=Paenibacillus TaxID=44249 RepID=UPI0004237A1E|nr:MULTISPECIES: nicotinate phosphoribosyltransferase [unclassified Paenibacillus]KKC47631.1 nicotinate phosphoribosyltransferase [Paenibacillus sp. D9]